MPRPLRVFLCHASKDKPAVWRLYRYLKQHRVQPWLDQADLLPGEDWQVEIPKAIDASDVILVCLSKNSVNKEGMVQKEITFALDKAQEKPEGTIFVIPVKLEQCDVPSRLNRYQWVDLFRQDGYRRLLMGLNKRATGLGSDAVQVLMPEETRPKSAPKIVSKRPEAENIELQRAEQEAREKAERDAAEKAPREKAEREAVERATRERFEEDALERARREKVEREAAEASARVKAEREAAEKKARERRELEAEEKARRDTPYPSPFGSPSGMLREGQGEGDDRSAGKSEQKKPSTKLLTPSSLSPRGEQSVRKAAQRNNIRWFGIGGIILSALVCGGFGLNYLIDNLPLVASGTPSPTSTSTSRPPASTVIPFTPTHQPTQTVMPTPTLGIGSTMISDKDGMTLLYVPAGEFLMGSTDADTSATSDEKPQHSVTLDAFWIDQTEVTNKQYAACVDAGACEPPSPTSSYTHSSYYGDSEFDDYPVIYVDWNKAKTYCDWAGRRLPTEAEWEKAARGTDGSIYPWGDESPGNDLLNYRGIVGDTIGVGAYPDGASVYGALDMAGNVWEWVADWYDLEYYQNSLSSNPLGPDSGQYRVLRGSSWYFSNSIVHSALRYRKFPSVATSNIGFRCSRGTSP